MHVLIVGQLHQKALAITKMAIQQGAKVRQADSIETALNVIAPGGCDVILANQADALYLRKKLEKDHLHIAVVECGMDMHGTWPYLALPPQAENVSALFQEIVSKTTDFIAHAPSMRKIINLIDRIAPSDASVLITGESGVGKEVIAKYIRLKSKRSQAPFVCVNCAAIPEQLMESELFGHEKGAFTGALVRRIGKFEEANGGTLLLDEITELPIHLQAKLLRAIQERTIHRLGGAHSIPLNIRIIATSNRDIAQAIKNQVIREDLYFRLNVINVHIPPLRERELDILPLAQHFMKKYVKSNQLLHKTLSKEAERCLIQHTWPGNVRELENVIHRAVLLSSDIIDIEDLQLPTIIQTEYTVHNLHTTKALISHP